MPLDVFGAIADPTRRRILSALRAEPCSVQELVEATGYHQPGVSRHLRILRDAGLVQVQPDGQRRLYSLCLEPFLELDAWISEHLGAFAGRLDRLSDFVDAHPLS